MSVLSKNSTRDKSLTIIALAIGAFFVSQGENWLDPYTARIVNLVAINAILAVSLNLIYGFTGMFSLGHAGFMAIGAYVCTLFILTPEQKEGQWILEPILPFLQNISLPFFFAVLAGGLVAAFFGVLIAVPVLRLGGDYLGIATLGFAEIIRVLIVNNAPITNGALGIKGIPQYSTIGWNFLWLAITVYVIMTLLRSNIGNVFKAIREDEIASQTMGVNIFWYKILSFSIGAFFAGVGGGLMAALVSTIDPTMFKFLQTFNILMIVVAGGLGSVTGSLIGSAVITFFLEWLRLVEDATTVHFPPAWTDMAPMFTFDIPGVPGMRMVIFSVLLMCIILYWRKGLLGTREFSWEGTIFGPLRVVRRFLSSSGKSGKTHEGKPDEEKPQDGESKAKGGGE